MSTICKVLMRGLILSLTCLPLCAQTSPSSPGSASADTNPSPAGQAPDEATKKVTELVHAGEYAEAQKLTGGLLIAYPDDQRLLKAKALIDKLLVSAGSKSAVAATNPAPQPQTDVNADRLTGMDKVDYNALIVLARQAQQTADLDEQKRLLSQFLEQSASFLQKHSDRILLWQLRATAAISLNEPTIAYQTGQQLLARGAADSNDPGLQILLGQLKNKGWLDSRKVALDERKKRFAWLLGTWNVNWKWWWGDVNSRDREVFIATESGIEGYLLSADGARNSEPDFKATILDSGDLKWESYLPPDDTGEMYVFRSISTGFSLVCKLVIGRRSDPNGYFGNHRFDHGLLYVNDTGAKPFYPFGWQPVISSEYDRDKHLMTIVVQPQEPDPELKAKFLKKYPVTLLFSRSGGSSDEQASLEDASK